MAMTPFIRYISTPFSVTMGSSQALNLPRSTSPSTVIPTEVTVASCSCSPSVLRNSGSISRVFSRSKALMFRTWSAETFACVERTIGANLLMALNLSSTFLSSASSGTKSHLLRINRSAKATCSTASFSAPSGFSSSRCCTTCFASTNVMMPSSVQNSLTSSSTKNVCATGAGSANPVVSITMASNLRPFSLRLASFFNTSTRSWRTVQQMQPFIISMTSSSVSVLSFGFMRASSIPTSPNSFSITAIFLPCWAVKMWFSSVVLPEPRKPVKIVTGTLSFAILLFVSMLSSTLRSALV
mmetsp:Transcript_19886/g.59330  ORF Transcript_19886/g.59330 Transcript_19886/m.59330 type:complete len:298 (-) Transcript_19886:1315-2208(-)